MNIKKMNFPMKKVTSAFIGAIVLSVSSGATAASVSGSPVTASADVVFSSSVAFTNTLTALEGLTSGGKAKGFSIAKGNVAFSAGATPHVALTFGAEALSSNGTQTSIAYGKSNSKNKIVIAMTDDKGNLLGANPSGAGIPSAFSLISVKDGKGGYGVNTYGAQNIAPDTYPVSVTAYAYTM